MTTFIAALMAAWAACLPLAVAFGGEGTPLPAEIPVEDYALYDQAVENIFLTSYTKLVMIERMTVTRLLPDQTEPMTAGLFQERNYFMGRLAPDLVRDFVGANREASRLAGRFQLGVRYRFVPAGAVEGPEAASAWPMKTVRATQAQALPVLDRLAFSRVGRTLRNDQALLYVENSRPDGSGAGFLVWFHREGREWAIFDTEVVWAAREDGAEGEERP